MPDPMTVVLDCGNGVAGELGPMLLKTLGCEVKELFCEIDGTFPNHHPDPSNPKNLSELIATSNITRPISASLLMAMATVWALSIQTAKSSGRTGK